MSDSLTGLSQTKNFKLKLKPHLDPANDYTYLPTFNGYSERKEKKTLENQMK